MSETRSKLDLPDELVRLAKKCEGAGFRLYVVGGVCREAFLGISGPDTEYDVCAAVPAAKFDEIVVGCGFRVVSEFRRLGTVKAVKKGISVEFTSFRTDSYSHGHQPDRVVFTDDILKDALRRDFTCDAVYYDISSEQFVDPLGGIADIEKGLCRAARDPADVFREDGLRLMRFARICAQTGLCPDAVTIDGAKKSSDSISEIVPERVWTELNAVLHADTRYQIKNAHYEGLLILWRTGVLTKIFPELASADGMDQHCTFHDYDVLQHSLRCVLYSSPETRLAALLHDVGKPVCATGDGHFYRHDAVGAEIAGKICRRLKVSDEETDRTRRLIALHMYDCDLKTSDKKIRKLIINNLDIWDALLDIKQADFSACKDDLSVAPCVEKWKRIYSDMKREGAPMRLRELAVNGNDLVASGVTPQKIGKILDVVLYECAIGVLPNTEEKIIPRCLSLDAEFKKE